MRALTLKLEPYQTKTLEQMRDHHPTPYLRERAAALLKIADGQSVQEVAKAGLFKKRKEDTIRNWINAYKRQGVVGLYQRKRRKRSFHP